MEFRKLVEYSCKRVLIDITVNSKHIRENLSFAQQINMCKWITKLSYTEALSLAVANGEPLDEAGISAYESKIKKALKYGLAGLAGGILGAGGAIITAPIGIGIALVTYYLFRKAMDPCVRRCVKEIGYKKKICHLNCHSDAIVNLIREIQKEKIKCPRTADPAKCERKLNKQIIKWTKKQEGIALKIAQIKAKKAFKKPTVKPVKVKTKFKPKGP